MKLFKVKVYKNIFVVSEDASLIPAEDVLRMAEDDGESWDTTARVVPNLAACESYKLTIPHSDDPEFARGEHTIEDFFLMEKKKEIVAMEAKLAEYARDGMLRIENRDHYGKVLAFAEACGLQHELYDALISLIGNGTCFGRPARVVLHYDFAPASFGFYYEERESGRHIYNGGLIFYGPTEAWGKPGPSFSVSLSQSNKPRWEKHT